MIYFLSDFHGDPEFKAFDEYLETANDDDLLIVLGDIGIKFEDTPENKDFTKKFFASNKNIAFLDGNHENFGFINSFPQELWNGGKVHRLTPNIVHLMRGEVYEIEGKTFFVFGGCKSSAKWKEMGLWFDGEEASKPELQNAYKNLEKADLKVDYILTHKYEPEDSVGNVSLPLQEICTFIDQKVDFKMWYFGHWHVKRTVDSKHEAIYDSLVKLR